ncbi:hypothetical protein ABK040_005738 [Willaertia magna]
MCKLILLLSIFTLFLTSHILSFEFSYDFQSLGEMVPTNPTNPSNPSNPDSDDFNYFVDYFTTGYENGTIHYQVSFANSRFGTGMSITKQCLFWGCNKLVINNPSLIDAKGMNIKDIVFEVDYARTLFSIQEENKGASKIIATLKVITEDTIRNIKRERQSIGTFCVNKKKNNRKINNINNKLKNNEVTLIVDLQGKIYFQVFNNGISTFKTQLENLRWSNLKTFHNKEQQIIYTIHNEQGGFVITQINYKHYNTSGVAINQSRSQFPFQSNYYNLGMGFDGKTIYTLFFENTDNLSQSKSVIITFDIVKKAFEYIPITIPSNFNSVDYTYFYFDTQKNIMYIIVKVTKDCNDRTIIGVNVIDGTTISISPIPRSTLLYIQPNPNVKYGNGTIIRSFSLGYERLNSAENLIAINDFNLLNWSKSNMKPFDYLSAFGNVNACQITINSNVGKEQVVKSVLTCSKQQDSSNVFSFLYYDGLTNQSFTQKVKVDEGTYYIYLL